MTIVVFFDDSLLYQLRILNKTLRITVRQNNIQANKQRLKGLLRKLRYS
jgi:hypothetical protein